MKEPIIIIAQNKNQFDVISYYEEVCKKATKKPICVIACGHNHEKLLGFKDCTFILGDYWDGKLHPVQRLAWRELIRTREAMHGVNIVKSRW